MTLDGAPINLGLGPEGLPATCIAAETAATTAHRRYLLLLGIQIALPLVAVAVGVAVSVNKDLAVLGVLASVTNVSLVMVRLFQRTTEVERAWYESRATAEEAKALPWRYAVRGKPFDRVGQTDEEAASRAH